MLCFHELCLGIYVGTCAALTVTLLIYGSDYVWLRGGVCGLGLCTGTLAGWLAIHERMYGFTGPKVLQRLRCLDVVLERPRRNAPVLKTASVAACCFLLATGFGILAYGQRINVSELFCIAAAGVSAGVALGCCLGGCCCVSVPCYKVLKSPIARISALDNSDAATSDSQSIV